ncbi:DUF4279 domain-containing protein [Streptomyces rectiverticillatus]|uniref:DUF4279 domain-containing protein n=1 Tax=Streptomyces rectiverticillatus TaxID=173860 RepID=UPI0015C30CD6|nr:DUF4279 domain-containing protein [Streptomyces rectiverticillatus]QLE73956.1 DUF4279 domain-containing protein [Streptomyces rectiverticillatus]
MLDRNYGWESVCAALVVTKPGLVPEVVDTALGLKGTAVDAPGQGSVPRGTVMWVYRPAEKSLDVERQLGDLVGELLPLQGALARLREQGFQTRVDVSGFVKTNSVCKLEARTLALVQQLGIPLSFTARVAKSEDDSGWLESILG